MTGGSESSFGSDAGPSLPVESSEEARDLGDSDPHAMATESAVPDAELTRETSAGMPRNTRPFRAWGAAHDRMVQPSVWARFGSWVGGLFSRDKKADAPADESSPVDPSEEPELRGATDEFDAPWRDPHPSGDVIARRSGARPSPDEFTPAWDDALADVEPPVVPDDDDAPALDPMDSAPIADTTAASDPLWDEPRVVDRQATPAVKIDRDDLDEIWTPPAPEASQLIAEAESAVEEEAVRRAAPRRPSFISRLFGRKNKIVEQNETISDFDEYVASHFGDAPPADPMAAAPPTFVDFADRSAPAAAAPTFTDFGDPSAPSSVEPAHEDFDDSPPVESIDREPPRRRSAALDHSSEDAAALADFLASAPPASPEMSDEELDAPTVAFSPAVHEMDVAAASEMDVEVEREEEAEADDDVEVEVEVDMEVDVDADVDAIDEQAGEVDALRDAPAADVLDESLLTEPVAPAPIVPAPEVDKKPGFFSRLVRRVSRSQFLPPAPAVEPPPAAVEASEPPAEPAHEEPAADWSETVGEMPAVTPLAQPVAGDFESTASFPAVPFIDARDDVPDEPPGRITEAVDLSTVVEGEKTDEFAAVPPALNPETAAAANAATLDIKAASIPGLLGRMLGIKKEFDGDSTLETGQPMAAVPKTVVESEKDGKAPFVIAKFRMFYNEIIRDKHQKSDVISGFATAIVSADATNDADPEFAAQLLSKRLSEMLELQAAESNWTGGDAVKYYPEAQYAMVALADETFSVIEWPGRSSWHKYMLEPRMYGTRGADLEFFNRVDKLLREPDPPKGARDLARVYLMVLASGFRGKFRVPNLYRPIAEYRRRLYEFSHGSDPLMLYARERRIFPEAEAHTLAGKAVGRFTARQKWVAAVIVLAVLYASLSQFAWRRISSEVTDVMSRIAPSTTVTTAAPGDVR